MNNKFELPTLKCLRCGHTWIPRRPKEPKVCPKCNSPYWNKPKWKGVKKMDKPKESYADYLYKNVLSRVEDKTYDAKTDLEIMLELSSDSEKHSSLSEVKEEK